MPILASKMSLKCHIKSISVLKVYCSGFYEKTNIFYLEYTNFSENIRKIGDFHLFFWAQKSNITFVKLSKTITHTKIGL